MTAPSENMPTDYEASAEEIFKLTEIIEKVAKGDYSNDIMEFTTPGHSEMIQRVAEAMGMMMVRVEARELRLEQLVEELRDLNRLLEKNTTQAVIAIAHALGARDTYTEGHADRVSVYSERLARKVGLPEKEVEQIRVGGVLHDIGKIGFSDRVFSDEDSSFNEGMLAEIHKHPDIVREIAVKLGNDPNITWFSVESENFESIHNHNAYAYIERRTADGA